MTDYSELVKKLRDLHRDPRPASAEWLFENQVALYDAAAAIEALQAQLPKRGKWELIDGAEPMRWGCSRCKYMSWDTSNYCPRCGAKMGGTE